MSSNPSLSLVDTHCHLNLKDFDSDRAEVLERARAAGVNRILVPGIDIETSWSAIEYSRQYPELYTAVGVHPNSATTWTNASFSSLKKMVAERKVVAIGEIGLDYYRNHAPHELQRSIFKLQLDWASELGLPVIIHNRNASEDVVEILLEWHQSLIKNNLNIRFHPGVLHSFSGDLEIGKKVIDANFKLGITGPVTFRNAQLLQSIILNVPLDSVLIETDAPFLAPHPFRGKRNEPANVRIVAEKIADLMQVPIDEVAKITTESADRLFDWRSTR